MGKTVALITILKKDKNLGYFGYLVQYVEGQGLTQSRTFLEGGT